jgi:hypothetical protein
LKKQYNIDENPALVKKGNLTNLGKERVYNIGNPILQDGCKLLRIALKKITFSPSQTPVWDGYIRKTPFCN